MWLVTAATRFARQYSHQRSPAPAATVPQPAATPANKRVPGRDDLPFAWPAALQRPRPARNHAPLRGNPRPYVLLSRATQVGAKDRAHRHSPVLRSSPEALRCASTPFAGRPVPITDIADVPSLEARPRDGVPARLLAPDRSLDREGPGFAVEYDDQETAPRRPAAHRAAPRRRASRAPSKPRPARRTIFGQRPASQPASRRALASQPEPGQVEPQTRAAVICGHSRPCPQPGRQTDRRRRQRRCSGS